MRKIVIIVISIVVIFLLTYLFFSKKNNYQKNFSELQRIRIEEFIEDPFSEYFLDNFECAENKEDILKFSYNKARLENILSNKLIDILSKNKSSIQYIPLYNKMNMKREGYLLISAGIDGKTDNNYKEGDTIFITEFDKKIDFYNELDLKLNNSYLADTNNTFNILDYLFGKKDYLLQYFNGIEFYKNQGSEVLTLDELIQYFESRKNKIIHKNYYGYRGFYYRDSIDHNKNEKFIFFNYNEFLVKNRIDTLHFSAKLGDTVILVGTFNDFDIENKFIEFKNCVQLDNP